uniref:Uncharacterized protein n=1 Tax=Aegilops tauschii subsp. strangulata TaxID=200361 RepID=A0A452ZJU4_AEGTS
ISLLTRLSLSRKKKKKKLDYLICLFCLWACICKPNRSKRYLTEGKSQLRRKVMKRLRRP